METPEERTTFQRLQTRGAGQHEGLWWSGHLGWQADVTDGLRRGLNCFFFVKRKSLFSKEGVLTFFYS